MSANASFAGVCLSALLIIPFLCSVAIKPIMKQIENKRKTQIPKKEVNSEAIQLQKPNNTNNAFKGLYSRNNYSMKVGGV